MLKRNKIIFMLSQLLRASRHGVTLLELCIAVTISAIVISLSLFVFSDLLRGFTFNKSRAQSVGDIVVAKKQIDKCLSDIVSIKECSDKSVTCLKNSADLYSIVKFAKGNLYLDSKVICGKLMDFSFTLEKKTKVGPWALLWNAHLEKSIWFGGAVYGVK